MTFRDPAGRRLRAAAAGALLLAGSAASAVAADGSASASAAASTRGPAGHHWVGAWTASAQSGGPASQDQSYRLLVHTSTGGTALRLRFSNRYGTAPVTVRNVTVALPTTPTGPAVDPASVRPVRFPGDALVIEAGSEGRSLPLAMDVPADTWLAVSFHAPETLASTTHHATAWGVNWQTPPGAGDYGLDPTGSAFAVPLFAWPLLTGVDVSADPSVSTVVALGDSITDAAYAVPHANTRWPDLLDRRLAREPGADRFSVVNAGINGNAVARDLGGQSQYGEAAVDRMDRDVLGVPNVSTLILFEGSNDIYNGVPAEEIQAAYSRIADKAHRRGIRVLIATLTPTAAPEAAADPPAVQLTRVRNSVNAWIDRNHRLFDGVLRFGEAVASPVSRDMWHPAYGSGDQTHPNPLGLKAMADSVPLGLLDDAPGRTRERRP